ncbi:uncharacterized protein [Primulina eburnea]|uniref:uncharacterized protein n=1 Tax=Primulina eburnea TaxID=1245227 RepID=UPI003C6C86C2
MRKCYFFFCVVVEILGYDLRFHGAKLAELLFCSSLSDISVKYQVFHLLIGTSNFGYLLYFGLTPLAACKDWLFWSQSCGFIIMAFPKILFVAAFLLLLSFWVDLCHQTNDDEEECSSREALLEKISKTDYSASSCCNICTFLFIEIGSRQKVVILVTVLVTAIMVASSLLIWIGMGKIPIDSVVVAEACCWFGHCMCCQFYIECFCCSCYKYSFSSVPSAFILFEMRELPRERWLLLAMVNQ